MANIQTSELTAKKWAKALMELALENENISKDEILSNLFEISATIDSSKELADVINNPSISIEEKNEVISKIFQDKIHPLVYNFLFVLNLKKRLNLATEIALEFEKELEEQKNILRIEITSAIELDDDKKNDIRNRVAEKLQKDVKVKWNVDSEIIAGLIFNIDNTVINNSVQYKLDSLAREIIKV